MKTQEITNEMFDNELMRILSEQRANQLIDIPGIYEILAEHYNNEIIDNLTTETGEE